uniref:Cytosolic non-specific dipeptidase-like isoform X1 n=3 Tax=Petromyzon marinus TaxID=7757 RepID=A0AAJ7U1Q5_PETMA|nr:cytosolic non-specific dipeptidase-like isoform X1 [Petromyzon marinus]
MRPLNPRRRDAGSSAAMDGEPTTQKWQIRLGICLLIAVMALPLRASSSESYMAKLFKHVDATQEQYVQELREWVAVQSVSAFAERRHDMIRMAEMAAERVRSLGGVAELAGVGNLTTPDGEVVQLPPVVLGTFGDDPAKPTVMAYGHLDVQPARKDDGWDSDPYVLTEKDGKLYGRGVSDNKAPVLAWLNSIEAFRSIGQPLPVNLRLVFESLEEVGSMGLAELLARRRHTFLRDVEHMCVSDSEWLSVGVPALSYGLRGNCYFFAEVTGTNKDLHSGTYGGSVHEALGDLVALMSSLESGAGNIAVPGLYDSVAPLTREEEEIYEKIHFDPEEFRKEIEAPALLYPTKDKILMHRWRYPALSLHGIEGAFADPGVKTVIPRRVLGKFSIRIVPNMDPDVVEDQVRRHLEAVFARRKSPNKLRVWAEVKAKPWVANVTDPLYTAGRRAFQAVHGREPDLIREGATIPIVADLERVVGKGIVLLPIGGADDAPHSQNEKVDRVNYINGIKLFAAFLHEVAQLPTAATAAAGAPGFRSLGGARSLEPNGGPARSTTSAKAAVLCCALLGLQVARRAGE